MAIVQNHEVREKRQKDHLVISPNPAFSRRERLRLNPPVRSRIPSVSCPRFCLSLLPCERPRTQQKAAPASPPVPLSLCQFPQKNSRVGEQMFDITSIRGFSVISLADQADQFHRSLISNTSPSWYSHARGKDIVPHTFGKSFDEGKNSENAL